MARRIGILSDTHGLLRPEVKAILDSCDCVIHGGDIDCGELLKELQAIAPLYAVKGNKDSGEWAESLDERLCVEIGGIRFFIVHDKKYAPRDPGDVDVVVFGHSHKYVCETKDGVLWLNPGGCGRRRFHLPLTMAVLEIGDKGFEVIRYDIEEAEA